jgi:alpha-tubulin suppressor-like RCC1 family protein
VAKLAQTQAAKGGAAVAQAGKPVSEYQCLIVRARGSGLSSLGSPGRNCSPQSWGIFSSSYLNPLHSSAPANASRELLIELLINEGPDRVFELIGYNPSDNGTCAQWTGRTLPQRRSEFLREAHVLAASEPVSIFGPLSISLSPVEASEDDSQCDDYIFSQNAVTLPDQIYSGVANTLPAAPYFCSLPGIPVEFWLVQSGVNGDEEFALNGTALNCGDGQSGTTAGVVSLEGALYADQALPGLPSKWRIVHGNAIQEFPVTVSANPSISVTSVTMSTASAEVYFTPLPGVSQYTLRYSNFPDFTSPSGPISANGSPHLVTGLLPGYNHYFQIEAEVPGFGTLLSAISGPYRSVNPLAAASWPFTISKIITDPGASNPRAQLSWTEVTGATHYRVSYSTSPSFSSYSSTQESAALSVEIPQVLSPYLTYYFRLEARNDSGTWTASTAPLASGQSIHFAYGQTSACVTGTDVNFVRTTPTGQAAPLSYSVTPALGAGVSFNATSGNLTLNATQMPPQLSFSYQVLGTRPGQNGLVSEARVELQFGKSGLPLELQPPDGVYGFGVFPTSAGAQSPRVYTLTNNDCQARTPSLTLSNPSGGATPFSMTHTCSGQLASGGYCTATITLTPNTTGVVAGAYSSSLVAQALPSGFTRTVQFTATLTDAQTRIWAGATSNWNNPSNWNPTVLPGPSDLVVIPAILPSGLTRPRADFGDAPLPTAGTILFEDKAQLEVLGGGTRTLAQIWQVAPGGSGSLFLGSGLNLDTDSVKIAWGSTLTVKSLAGGPCSIPQSSLRANLVEFDDRNSYSSFMWVDNPCTEFQLDGSGGGANNLGKMTALSLSPDPTRVGVRGTGQFAALGGEVGAPVEILGALPALTRIGDNARVEIKGNTASQFERKFSQIASGESHTCGLSAKGQILCWGGGSYDAFPELVSQNVQNLQFESISAGSQHTCAISTLGLLYCWGNNGHGQIGDGTYNNQQFPTFIGDWYQHVSAGPTHTCAIRDFPFAGRLYCWGSNTSNNLGGGSSFIGQSNLNSPIPVDDTSSYLSVSAGASHACGITTAGVLKCWGSNTDYRLGLGTNSVPDYSSPEVVSPGTTFQSVSAGTYHSCAISTAGELMCWGGLPSNSNLLGIGVAGATVPTTVAAGQTYRSVRVGIESTCAIRTSGKVDCWGENPFGILGTGTLAARSSPTPIDINTNYFQLSLGSNFACGLLEAASSDLPIKCWGRNNQGQLAGPIGFGSGDILAPIRVAENRAFYLGQDARLSILDPSHTLSVEGSVFFDESSKFKTSSSSTVIPQFKQSGAYGSRVRFNGDLDVPGLIELSADRIEFGPEFKNDSTLTRVAIRVPNFVQQRPPAIGGSGLVGQEIYREDPSSGYTNLSVLDLLTAGSSQPVAKWHRQYPSSPLAGSLRQNGSGFSPTWEMWPGGYSPWAPSAWLNP